MNWSLSALIDDGIIEKIYWCQQSEDSYLFYYKHFENYIGINNTIISYVSFPFSTIENMLRNSVPVFH